MCRGEDDVESDAPPRLDGTQMFWKFCLRRLVLEEVLDGFVGNHFLIEGVRTLSVLHHLDDLGVATAIGLARLQGSDCFFCHGASVFT